MQIVVGALPWVVVTLARRLHLRLPRNGDNVMQAPRPVPGDPLYA